MSGFPKLNDRHSPEKRTKRKRERSQKQRLKTEQFLSYENKKIKLSNISDLLGKKTPLSTEKHQTISYSSSKKHQLKQEKVEWEPRIRQKKMSNIQMCQENLFMYDLLKAGKVKRRLQAIRQKKKDEEENQKRLEEETAENKSKAYSSRMQSSNLQEFEFTNLKLKKLKTKEFKLKLTKKRYKDLSIREMIYDDKESNIDGSVEKTFNRMRAVTQSKIDYNDVGDCW